jgi:hypothetical protein
VFKDFVVRRADSHIGSWIAEFFSRLRHECVKGTEEATLQFGQTIWMFDFALLNHIQDVNLRCENLSECNRIGRSLGGRLSEVGRKKNSLERECL